MWSSALKLIAYHGAPFYLFFILFYFILFYFILFYFILFYFILGSNASEWETSCRI